MPSIIGSSVLKSVNDSNQLLPYRKNPFQHVNCQARFGADPCGTNLLCWTWLVTTRQEQFACPQDGWITNAYSCAGAEEIQKCPFLPNSQIHMH